MSRLEWVRRTLLRQKPITIRLDGYEDDIADVRVRTKRAVDPRDVKTTVRVTQLDSTTCAVDIRAQYNPETASNSSARYTYEDTFRVTGSCIERPPIATNVLAGVFGEDDVGRPLPFDETVDLTEYASPYKTSVYFELSFA